MVTYNYIQLAFLVSIGLATLYLFIFAFAGLFYKQSPYPFPKRNRKIAVLIPGYKEDEVIIEVAESALLQDYPLNHFDVVVIADSFKQKTLDILKKLPIKLIEVSFKESTKSKALCAGMNELHTEYEVAVILDADNIMAADFLSKINASFEQGHLAIQGHRTAKNKNNSWAILDAVSEEINNHIFRKGHRVLGLSSAIIGSGMAFRYDYFKTLMSNIKAVGGFDKEIELKMLKAGHKIMYLDDAVIFDEKIQQKEALGNQRRRWLSAQLHYFRKDFFSALKNLLLKGNIDYFDKAVQFIQPPRILLLGALIFSGIFFTVTNQLLHNSVSYSISWLIITIACMLSFLFSIPLSYYNAGTFRALSNLPGGMLTMLLSLLKIKGANKKFIHTKHTAGSR